MLIYTSVGFLTTTAAQMLTDHFCASLDKATAAVASTLTRLNNASLELSEATKQIEANDVSLNRDRENLAQHEVALARLSATCKDNVSTVLTRIKSDLAVYEKLPSVTKADTIRHIAGIFRYVTLTVDVQIVVMHVGVGGWAHGCRSLWCLAMHCLTCIAYDLALHVTRSKMGLLSAASAQPPPHQGE